MNATKSCGCNCREHLGQGVYKCLECGHIWDTWQWCAPIVPNGAKHQIVEQNYLEEEEEEYE